MAGRYLISGVQLALLKTQADNEELLEQIEEDQFITNSDVHLGEDVKEWRKKSENQ